MMRFPFLAIAWPACACWALAQPPASATRPPPPTAATGDDKDQPATHAPMRLLRGERHLDDDKTAEPAEQPKNE